MIGGSKSWENQGLFCINFYISHEFLHFDQTDAIKYDIVQNVKTGQIYSDNVTLCVVDLNKTELATDEDKKYGIDKWAKLFKAKTWEAVKMLAKEDVYINEASKTIYELCADFEVKKRCWEREEFEDYAERLAESEARLAESEAKLAQKDAALEQAEKYRKWALAHGYKED